MPVDIPKPDLWLPPRPAIVRAASMRDVERASAAARRRDAALQASTIFINPFVFAAAVTPLDITKTAEQTSASDTNSYNMGTLAIGTAATGRLVLVVIGARRGSAATVSGVTIGGNAATHVVTANNTGSGADIASIYGLQVDAGTTAAIVVNFDSTMLRCGVIIYALYNAPSISPHATLTDTTISSGVMGGNINVPANGAAVGVAWHSGTTPAFTWSGLTEDLEQSVETANNTQGAASLEFATDQTPLAVSVTSSDTATAIAAAAWASWGP